jgi:hypothetical protein
MKTNTLVAIGSVVATATALNLVPMRAQAVELISNGDFSLNNLTALVPSGVTNTGYAGVGNGVGTAATATDWVFAPASVNATHESLVWLSATGTTYSKNLNILGGGSGVHKLYGTAPLNLPGGGSGFFLAADGDRDYGTKFSQTLAGLIAGEQYNVSFYQAAGQQNGLDGHTTEWWEVSLGGSVAQLSTVMSPPEITVKGITKATGVSGWQQENLTFTAGSTNQLLSFFANGTPSGKPPIALLSNVSVQGRSSLTATVPEPADYVGTLLGMGVVGILVKSRLAKQKLDAQD